MRSSACILLFFLFPASAFTQLVKGRIIDTQSREPVPFATIYFNGTFKGTSSDREGRFQIDASGFSSMPLTISAIGYYSHTLSDFSIGGPLVIPLTPKVYELGEVQVSGKDAARRRKSNLKTFRKEFLGTTSNARRCEILNEEVISFIYDLKKDSLQAFAMEPIEVYNKALAYKVTYYLDQFELNKRTSSLYFSGNILFTEDDSTFKRYTTNRRKRAYMGSRRHFFRTLWAEELNASKYEISASSGSLSCQDVVIVSSSNTKFLKYPESLEVHFRDKWSLINFKMDSVYFEEDGYFDPNVIGWEGELGRKRIGDSLPYEYTLSL